MTDSNLFSRNDIYSQITAGWNMATFQNSQQFYSEMSKRCFDLAAVIAGAYATTYGAVENVGKNRAAIEDLSNKLTVLGTTLKSTSDSQDKLLSENEAFKTAVNDLTKSLAAQVAAIKGTVNSINSSVLDMQGRLTKLEGVVDADLIQKAINTANSVSSRLAELVNSFNTLRSSITQNSSDIGELTNKLTNTAAELKSTVSNSEASLKSYVSSQVSAMANTVGTLSATVSENNQKSVDRDLALGRRIDTTNANLSQEIARAKTQEDAICATVKKETERAKQTEQDIRQGLMEEGQRAQAEESKIANHHEEQVRQLTTRIDENGKKIEAEVADRTIDTKRVLTEAKDYTDDSFKKMEDKVKEVHAEVETSNSNSSQANTRSLRNEDKISEQGDKIEKNTTNLTALTNKVDALKIASETIMVESGGKDYTLRNGLKIYLRKQAGSVAIRDASSGLESTIGCPDDYKLSGWFMAPVGGKLLLASAKSVSPSTANVAILVI